jgi:hypothetical protein
MIAQYINYLTITPRTERMLLDVLSAKECLVAIDIGAFWLACNAINYGFVGAKILYKSHWLTLAANETSYLPSRAAIILR